MLTGDDVHFLFDGNPVLRFGRALATVTMLTVSVGCARLGYTDRILHRLASPDGELVAVCQEVPVLDGPEFDVRVERPDGAVIRELFHMGDGGGCSEMAWSPDGSLLAVLTSHVADITVVDVQWAISHLRERNAHWFRRGFSFSPEGTLRHGTGLRFASNEELEFEVCEYSLEETRRSGGAVRCASPLRPQRVRVPAPFVANRHP